MKVRLLFASACALVLFTAAPALAQGKVAVTAATSGIGLQIPAGSALSIRPEFGFSKSSTESTNTTITADSDATNVAFAVNAPIYFGPQDRVRLYVSPRFAIDRTKSTVGSTDQPAQVSKSVAGSLGAETRVNDRFMIFGELGVQYGWRDYESTTLATTTKVRATGTRAAIGIGIFF